MPRVAVFLGALVAAAAPALADMGPNGEYDESLFMTTATTVCAFTHTRLFMYCKTVALMES
jgi:hypothetical protein